MCVRASVCVWDGWREGWETGMKRRRGGQRARGMRRRREVQSEEIQIKVTENGNEKKKAKNIKNNLKLKLFNFTNIQYLFWFDFVK